MSIFEIKNNCEKLFIQEKIKRPLAEELLFGKLEHGGTVRITVKDKEDGSKGIHLEIIEVRSKAQPSADAEDDVENQDEGEKAAPAKANKRSRLGGPRRSKKTPPNKSSGSGGGGKNSIVPKVPLMPQ